MDRIVLDPNRAYVCTRTRYTRYTRCTGHNSVNVTNLKVFNYDPSMGLPADTARRDYMEYFVEKVLGHTGDSKKPTTMSFHVKWLNYDDSHNTWEPWKNLRLCDALHVYLRNNNMSRFVPSNIEGSTDEV